MIDVSSWVKQSGVTAGKVAIAGFGMAVAMSVSGSVSGAQAQEPIGAGGAAGAGAPVARDLGRPGTTQSRLGGFLFDGSASLRAIFDDNVFFEPANEVDDLRFEFAPQINIRSNFPRHWLNAKIGAEAGVYAELSDDNYVHGNIGFDAGLNMTRQWDLWLKGGFASLTERRGDDDEGITGRQTEPTEKTNAGVEIGTEVRFVRAELTGKIKYTNIDYSDTDRIGATPLEQDDRDRDIIAFTGGLKVMATPRLMPYVIASVADIDFANPDATQGGGVGIARERDGTFYYIQGGINVDFTGVLSGSAGVGYQSRRFDDNFYDTIDGPRFNVNLTWLPTKLMSLSWYLDQSVGETTINNSGGFTATNTELQFAYEVLRNFTLGAHLGFDVRDFDDISRQDDRLRIGLGGTYAFNRYLTGNLRYRHVNRDSNETAIDFDYTQNIVSLNLVGRF